MYPDGITLVRGGQPAVTGDVFAAHPYWVVYVAGVLDRYGGVVYGGNEWQVRRALDGHVAMSGPVVDCVAYPFSEPVASVFGREKIETHYRAARDAVPA